MTVVDGTLVHEIEKHTTIGDATLWHRKQALRWGDATISATLDLEERKKGGWSSGSSLPCRGYFLT